MKPSSVVRKKSYGKLLVRVIWSHTQRGRRFEAQLRSLEDAHQAELESARQAAQREVETLAREHRAQDAETQRQLEYVRKTADSEIARVQRRAEAELADLRATISRLEVDLMKVRNRGPGDGRSVTHGASGKQGSGLCPPSSPRRARGQAVSRGGESVPSRGAWQRSRGHGRTERTAFAGGALSRGLTKLPGRLTAWTDTSGPERKGGPESGRANGTGRSSHGIQRPGGKSTEIQSASVPPFLALFTPLYNTVHSTFPRHGDCSGN